ncbi:MAG: hypothetical protein AAAC48_27740, partial [Phyllobacterium sp.]|uniref:hypothetical protein n=1 Tax=Phyllobacterium sp. TaxID=1871046 RepID=UPI0030F1F3EF
MARRFEQHYLVAFAFLKRNRSALSKLTDSLPPDGGIDLHQVAPSGSFLTRIKNEHELVRMIWHKLAFVALDKQSGELAGIGRLSSDPDHEIAEYAVLVRTDLQ